MAYDGSQPPARRRTWPRADKERMVREVAESGLSVAAVARRNGVHPCVLGRWCRKTAPAAPGFLPVQVTAPEEAAARVPEEPSPVEIVLTNGRRLIVPATIAPPRLRTLVAALEGA
ncbi:IS66-like element accessory protein TnpA [Caenispirillum salinarum]|uniref:IS66-like element accessory protein TnpA n=1 Tax=Caenispirillum salinarum TaxID=859058 RepID=UPI00384E7768